MSSHTHSPCAACKFLRRKCTQECVFAPYFPPDQPQKFANVHRVYGASNVAKILNELNAAHREDAVTSLAYEAEARLRDPVYGCVGFISILQNRLKQVQNELYTAKKELSTYIGPQALMIPFYHPDNNGSSMPLLGVPTSSQPSGGGQLVIRDLQQQQQQQMFEAQQQELVRFNINNGMDAVASSVNGNGYTQMGGGAGATSGVVQQPGSFDHNNPYGQIHDQAQQQQQQQSHHHHQLDYQLQAQLLLQPQKSEGEEN